LVEDAVREFPLWSIFAPIVQGSYLAAVLFKLSSQQIVVSRLSSEPIAVLG
jgi:hypothetical protein